MRHGLAQLVRPQIGGGAGEAVRDVGQYHAGVDRAPGPDSQTLVRDGVLATVEIVRAAGCVAALEPEPVTLA